MNNEALKVAEEVLEQAKRGASEEVLAAVLGRGLAQFDMFTEPE